MSGARWYRKRPVLIQAVRFDGTSSSVAAISRWMEGGEYVTPSVSTRDVGDLEIDTLEGVMTASPGDWVIRGVAGEFYPCRSDIFEATYDVPEVTT